MNKVDALEEKLKIYTAKIRKQQERIKKKCKHKNTERWSDYGGINEQCKDCNHWLR